MLAARTNYRMQYPDYRERRRDPVAEVARDTVDGGREHFSKVARAPHAGPPGAVPARLADPGSPARRSIATDKLRAQYGSGNAAADRQLEQLYFQYGRYLLIASSRAGSLPANLQGVWNDIRHAAVERRLSRQHQSADELLAGGSRESRRDTPPLFDFVDHLVPPGKLAAQRYFGAGGWTMFLNTNAWGYVGPIDWPTAFWQPEASAWLAQHFYEHYLFSRDTEFLKQRAWPVMKGAAEFWLDALVTDPRDGKLIVSPSYSPEHGPFTAGASMSQQIVADLFTNASEAARLVGDKAFAPRVDEALGEARSRPAHRQAWSVAGVEGGPRRHERRPSSRVAPVRAASRAAPLIPAKDPDLAAAARATLDARGDASTGWSRAWKINFWARLRDGDRAHKLLEGLLRDSTLPNLWDTHPPFQIDGNFGAAAGMIEMLLQSQNGEIIILPAMPKAWSKGSVSGIRARGDVTVAIDWDHCGANKIALDTGHDGPITLRSAMLVDPYNVKLDLAKKPKVLNNAGSMVTFEARRGGRYIFTRAASVPCADVKP